jgi:hypothetical protein
MNLPIATLLPLVCAAALAVAPTRARSADAAPFVEQPFVKEYAWGVQRLPLDGGRLYGWEMNDALSFGRMKGETDDFGFSVRMNARERVEVTTEGVRWRRSIGGAR